MKNPTGLDLDYNIQIILYNGADLINAFFASKVTAILVKRQITKGTFE